MSKLSYAMESGFLLGGCEISGLGAEIQRRGQRAELSTLVAKVEQRAAEAQKLDPLSPAVKDVTTRALDWAAKLSIANE